MTASSSSSASSSGEPATAVDRELDARPPAVASPRPASLRWRVVDIVVAAVLGVAVGIIFILWSLVGSSWGEAFDALTPGFGGLTAGLWLLGGTLGGLIIRKPGAALFVELVAAAVEMLASQWGPSALFSGLAQGLGAELVFALFLYRRFGPGFAMLAGAGAAVLECILELFMYGNLEKGIGYNLIYLVAMIVSGVLFAGLLGWVIARALAATGALDRLASGRAAKRV